MSATAQHADLAPRLRAARQVRLPSATWGTALAVAAVMAGLAALLRPSPVPPQAVHLAQLTLAGAAAFLLDDAAAGLTGVAPPPLWLRRAVRTAAGLAVLTPAWLAILVVVPERARAALTLEVSVLVVVTLAASSIAAARDQSEPGTTVGSAVVLAGVGAMLTGMVLDHVVFVSDAGPHASTTLVGGWVCLGVVSLALLARNSRDPAARRQGSNGRRDPGSATHRAQAGRRPGLFQRW